MESMVIPGSSWARSRLADAYGDRLEALTNLAFLMREDIDRQERLREYLRYMDMVIESMRMDEYLLDA